MHAAFLEKQFKKNAKYYDLVKSENIKKQLLN